jgi:hypothetical protein
MSLEHECDSLSQFMYGLKATESRRQWPQRLKMFFNFLKIEGDLDHQPIYFVKKAREYPQRAQESFIQYI